MNDQCKQYRIAAFKVLDAVQSYLPPDGIGKEEFISRVIEAVDNPDFNSALYTNSREEGEFDEGATVRRAPEHG